MDSGYNMEEAILDIKKKKRREAAAKYRQKPAYKEYIHNYYLNHKEHIRELARARYNKRMETRVRKWIRFTPDEKEEILDKYKEKNESGSYRYRVKDLAEYYGCTSSAINNLANRNGIVRRERKKSA